MSGLELPFLSNLNLAIRCFGISSSCNKKPTTADTKIMEPFLLPIVMTGKEIQQYLVGATNYTWEQFLRKLRLFCETGKGCP
jgi:hypothetical protein